MYAHAHLELLRSNAARDLDRQDARAIQDAESEGWPVPCRYPAALRPATPWRHYFFDRASPRPFPGQDPSGRRRCPRIAVRDRQ
ncbi:MULTISPECIES: hypothetical protein [Lysobacter]|uniref:Uncharacterized protein n=1 Tax=Lysobacter firmicutimachus TaxID=1792846 RepID=A0ABU8D184_9GAMM|nr:hypothetical protein [Lysobacter antibioticus]